MEPTPVTSQPIAPAINVVANGLVQAERLLELSQQPDVLQPAREIFLSGVLSTLRESVNELLKIARLVDMMESGKSISLRINQPKSSVVNKD